MKKKSLTKNYILNSIYQIFAIIVPLITTPYISQRLLPDNVGINSYVNSIVTLFTTIGLLGLNNYSVREIAYVRKDQEKLNKVFSEMFFLRIIFMIITLLIYLIFAYSNSNYFNYYMIYLFTFIATFLDITWLFQAMEELQTTVIRSIIIKTLSTISIFIFIKDSNDLNLLMLIYSLTSFVSTFVLYFSFRKIITKIYFKNIDMKRHIIPNLKLFLPQVATLIYCQFDKVMINDLTGEVAQVGFYNQAEKVVKIPLTLITSLSTVMLPRISEEFINKNIKKLKEYISTAFRFSMLLAIPLTFGLIAISYGFIPWFLGPGYEASAPILISLSVTVIFISLSNVSGAQYLTATNQTRKLTISYCVSAVVNLLLNFIFIKKFGALGATIGTIVAEALVAIIQISSMKSVIHFIDILKFSVKYIISGIIMIICCSLLYLVLSPSILLTLLQIIIGFIVYFALLYLLKDEMFIKYCNRFISKFKSLI